MEKKINYLVAMLEISKAQAGVIVNEYLNELKDMDIKHFVNAYFKYCFDEKPVGTSFEKLNIFAQAMLLEHKLRFENADEFLKWLKLKFKGHYFYEIKEGETGYGLAYYDKEGNKTRSEKIPLLAGVRVGLNKWGEFVYDGHTDLIDCISFRHEKHINSIKSSLFDLLFKRQREFKKLEFVGVNETKSKATSFIDADTYDKHYLELKEANNRLYDKNVAEFEKRLNYELARL